MNQTKDVLKNTRTKEEEIIKNYVSSDLRVQKVNEKDIRNKIRQDYQLANPAALQQTIDGTVFKYEEKLNKNQEQIQDKNYKFKPDMARTLKHDFDYKCSMEVKIALVV